MCSAAVIAALVIESVLLVVTIAWIVYKNFYDTDVARAERKYQKTLELQRLRQKQAQADAQQRAQAAQAARQAAARPPPQRAANPNRQVWDQSEWANVQHW